MGWTEVVSGAAGGAVASIAASAVIAERGERGRQRAHARRAVRAVVSAFAQQVVISDLRRGAGPADDLRAVQSERQMQLARDVVTAADGLGRIRAWRVRRALVALVGPLHVGLAEDLPQGDFAGDTVRSTLWFAAHPEIIERHVTESPLLDVVAKDQSDERAWAEAARGVQRLLRCV